MMRGRTIDGCGSTWPPMSWIASWTPARRKRTHPGGYRYPPPKLGNALTYSAQADSNAGAETSGDKIPTPMGWLTT
ncbi:hypothetical protein SAMN02990966_07199 [Rhodospirillales bacterium URHD0017]|nr:hypothetical protein SAMN02990966_07199 [Rhodospirillales bacterium URHD0017]